MKKRSLDLVLCVLIFIFSQQGEFARAEGLEISAAQLINEVVRGNVRSIRIHDHLAEGVTVSGTSFRAPITQEDTEYLLSKIRETKAQTLVLIAEERQPTDFILNWVPIAFYIVLALTIATLILVFIRRRGKKSN